MKLIQMLLEFMESIKNLYENLKSYFLRYGTLNVTVIDLLKRPIKGATIQIFILNLTTTTDSNGKATLRRIPYNNYTVKVTSTQ